MSDNRNGIDRILDKIKEYADESAGKILSESNARSEEVIGKARLESERRDLEDEKAFSAELERFRAQSESDYAAYERDKVLSLKQEMLAEAYAHAVKTLAGSSPDRKLQLYRKWLAKYGGEGAYSVILNRADRELLGDVLLSEMRRGDFPGTPRLSEYCAEIAGGLILDFGETRIDVSFEALAAEQKGKADGELLDILFREEKA